jgi:hypothetical protein
LRACANFCRSSSHDRNMIDILKNIGKSLSFPLFSLSFPFQSPLFSPLARLLTLWLWLLTRRLSRLEMLLFDQRRACQWNG